MLGRRRGNRLASVYAFEGLDLAVGVFRRRAADLYVDGGDGNRDPLGTVGSLRESP